MDNSQLETEIIKNIESAYPSVVEIDEILKIEFGDENVDYLDRFVFRIKKILANFPDKSIEEIVANIATENAYVRFPKVTVTNENDEHIDIYDLFVKIPVTLSGKMAYDFEMLRSTYTRKQYANGYCHSHLPKIYRFSDVTDFKKPCLGRGPIIRTIETLKNSYSKEMWGLFAYELKLYVQTESVKGVPYVYMRTVSGKKKYADRFSISLSDSDKCIIDKFIKWICENNKIPFKFGFRKGYFNAGTDTVDAVFGISEVFCEWYNNVFFSSDEQYPLKNYISECIVDGSDIYKYDPESPINTSSFYPNTYMGFLFKGEEVFTKIIDGSDDERNTIPLLADQCFNYIMFKFTTILNIYEKHNTECEETDNPVKIVL